ncbi:MAG: T9SS type A sorting domain-containing protein [Bacteroidota bacterium]|nr:T9SS type A sorting domain-containing protein [Bacteroidota bacterium]
MKIKSLLSFAFACVIGVLNAQAPVKTTLNPFNFNHQETKVKKRSLETDLPEFEIQVRWDEDSDGWSEDDIDTTINVYSDNGWLTSRTRIYSWGSKSRYAYTYDGAGRELTRLTYRYMNGKWDTSGFRSYTYDENGLTKQRIVHNQYINNRWDDTFMSRYTSKVDNYGRITEKIIEGWNVEDGYSYDEKVLYFYGSDGNLNKFESYEFDDSLNAFVPDVKYDSISWHTYIKNDEELEKSKPLYASGVGFGPKVEYTITWSYDKHDNLLEQTTFVKDDQGNESEYSERYEYTYDSKGRCTQRIEFDYDEEEGVHIPSNKWIYAKFYTAPNLATEDLIVNETVYPNPAVGCVFFKEKVTELKIINMQGQQQLSVEFLQADAAFDISSLTPGTYILRYRNKQGLVRASRLLVR